MLSTKNDLREVYTGKKNRNNERIKKLQMVVDYNSAKQGIDLSDQMASYFSPLRKTIRWYHKIAFEFLLNTAVVNSLVLYKMYHPNTKIADFRRTICEYLCGTQCTPRTTSSRHFLKNYEGRDSRKRVIRKRCANCYVVLKKSVGRIVAIKKTKKVTTFCNGCVGKPALCLSCFNKLH